GAAYGGDEQAEQERTGHVDGQCAPREHRVMPRLDEPVDEVPQRCPDRRAERDEHDGPHAASAEESTSAVLTPPPRRRARRRYSRRLRGGEHVGGHPVRPTYRITSTGSIITSPSATISSSTGRNPRTFSSASTITMMIGRSSDSESNLAV